MKLYLAPMEGLTDFYMRDLLTRISHYDACVTEFIRVTDRLHSERVFFQACPELRTAGKTASGVPVHVQLLGSEPLVLADNAARAVALGAPSIDLNFGCPAKTVNRHRGGAVLLDEPETIAAIVQAVRKTVPAHIPVTAKIRLGFNDRRYMIENAQAIEAAGANALVVHARTKLEAYRPPAHWEAIAEIREAVRVPLMANGEIWTAEDARQCQQVSGCMDLMLGRGAVSDPELSDKIRGQRATLTWEKLKAWQLEFLQAMQLAGTENNEECFGALWTERGAVGRYKQWLAMLVRAWPEALDLFNAVKKQHTVDEIRQLLLAQ